MSITIAGNRSFLLPAICSLIFDALPVHCLTDLCLFRQYHILQRPALEFLETGAVYDVADVFLAAGSVGIDVLLYIIVGIQNDPDNAVLVCPFDKVLAHPGILLAGSAQQGEPVVFLLAASPGPVRAIDNTFTAADAFLSIPDMMKPPKRNAVLISKRTPFSNNQKFIFLLNISAKGKNTT